MKSELLKVILNIHTIGIFLFVPQLDLLYEEDLKMYSKYLLRS